MKIEKATFLFSQVPEGGTEIEYLGLSIDKENKISITTQKWQTTPAHLLALVRDAQLRVTEGNGYVHNN